MSTLHLGFVTKPNWSNSPRVLLAVEDDVTVEAVGDFELKGIRRPIATYNVLAAKSAN